jgi:surface antigen
MKITIIAALLSVSLIGTTACDKETLGTLGGAAGGGLLGSQVGGGKGKVLATVGGTLLGAYLGNRAVNYFNDDDAEYAVQAERRAYEAPIGQDIRWENPDSGNYGTITPVREGRTRDGQYCREFQQQIYVEGRTENAAGRACQQRDGSWKIVSG